LLSVGNIHSHTVHAVREACGDLSGAVDIVVRGPGGCSCCAYLVARELRRRFDPVGAFVPLQAKSAATLVALAADELVMGALGELGPLDMQFSEKQKADFPVDRSCLERFKALEQLQNYAVEAFQSLVRSVIDGSGMRAEDACRIGTDFAGKVCGALYAQIDPRALSESARFLEEGMAYAERVLRRYRPELYARSGPAIIERLVKGYPSHGFVIDLEELDEIGIPARPPAADEADAVEEMARALSECDGTVIEMVTAGAERQLKAHSGWQSAAA